jgi:hypothetical protein
MNKHSLRIARRGVEINIFDFNYEVLPRTDFYGAISNDVKDEGLRGMRIPVSDPICNIKYSIWNAALDSFDKNK